MRLWRTMWNVTVFTSKSSVMLHSMEKLMNENREHLKRFTTWIEYYSKNTPEPKETEKKLVNRLL